MSVLEQQVTANRGDGIIEMGEEVKGRSHYRGGGAERKRRGSRFQDLPAGPVILPIPDQGTRTGSRRLVVPVLLLQPRSSEQLVIK